MTDTQLTLPNPDGSPFGEPIYSYSRAQAIEDGVLVDVTEIAQQVGFRFPVAITVALYERLCPSIHDVGQEYHGRLWDVLWMAALKARLPGSSTDTINFIVTQQEADPRSGDLRDVDIRLWAVCSPGDEREPVVTIGFPQDF